MRPNPLRLLVLALPLLALAGCGTTRSCGSDTDYLQAVERPPIKLPADFTPSERIQPLAIPPVDPNPADALKYTPHSGPRRGSGAVSARKRL